MRRGCSVGWAPGKIAQAPRRMEQGTENVLLNDASACAKNMDDHPCLQTSDILYIRMDFGRSTIGALETI